MPFDLDEEELEATKRLHRSSIQCPFCGDYNTEIVNDNEIYYKCNTCNEEFVTGKMLNTNLENEKKQIKNDVNDYLRRKFGFDDYMSGYVSKKYLQNKIEEYENEIEEHKANRHTRGIYKFTIEKLKNKIKLLNEMLDWEVFEAVPQIQQKSKNIKVDNRFDEYMKNYVSKKFIKGKLQDVRNKIQEIERLLEK